MEKMSLKAFWEAVEQRLAAYSADELRAVLRAMAQETPPSERQAFLDKLKPPEEAAAVAVQEALQQEDLLADIDDLAQELQAEMEGAEYSEERYGWDEYHEEDSLGLYEEFVEPLTVLFDRAEAAFDYGHLALARAAYEKLFEVLGLEDEYGRGVRADDLSTVDIAGAVARYLRAVYEAEVAPRRGTEPPTSRPQVLFERMWQMRSWRPRSRPMLNDLIQISTRPLPDQDRFFEDWIAFLREQSGAEADAWLREAIRLSQGTPGIEKLARTEGTKRPRAYLDWFAALEGEGKYRQVLAAAQEALQKLPGKLPIRAAVADYLYAAANRLGETQTLRTARWEAFLAKPTLSRLLDLWDVTPSEERTRLMKQAAQYAKDYLAQPSRSQGMQTAQASWSGDALEQPVWIDKSVLAHAYLLAEDWDAAHQLATSEQVLGWSGSNNPQGLVVSFFLVLLSGKTPDALPQNLAQLWRETLQNSLGFVTWDERGDKEGTSVPKRLERVYGERLSSTSLSSGEQEKFLSWCLEVARKRVNAIVSDQHRGSYARAATLIAACAEVLQLRERDKEADAVLDDVRNRFPRHRAFQTELKFAIQRMQRSRQ